LAKGRSESAAFWVTLGVPLTGMHPQHDRGHRLQTDMTQLAIGCDVSNKCNSNKAK
jgi:hypothetical protein